MYTARKRRKPAQKGVKPAPAADSTRSNPSKRHRDRLNSELDRLAAALPFPHDVVSSLDKLSILRLSVSFLRTKSFFSVTLKNQLLPSAAERSAAPGDGVVPEGELLLQALNGFVLVVTAEGTVFFCSPSIQDYLGFHQTDVMHHSVLELIHSEDQQQFRSNLHWALNPPAGPSTDGGSVPSSSCLVSYNPDQLPPENSSFLERGFVCRFRCLLDNSSGFLALNIQGRLKFLHGQNRQGSAPPQLALFAIATPLQSPAILEIRTRNMIFRTKHKLDFTPMSCDAKGKIVLGYTEAELRVRGSGYQFIHAADMLHCAENHVCMMKTGESGLTVFRLLTKDSGWRWVQSNARLVYRSSRPDYIIATQRPLGDEEGGEHLRKRAMHLPFTFATGEAALYQTGGSFRGNGSGSKKGKLDETGSDDLDPKSLLEALMSQDESVAEPEAAFHGGLFGGRAGGGGVLGGSSSADSWHAAPGGETGRCDGRAGGDDPLLAALDSLSLDGVEPCSNSELFSALENLGLDAEDLELLLLDERRIQVEPGHAPMLADLLADNQILSYVHDSLERGTPGEGPPHSVSRQPQAAGPLRAAPGPQGQQGQHPLRLQLHQPGVQLTTNVTPDPCRYQSSYQLQGDHRLQQPPPQSSALELDRLLGLAGPQLGLPSFESYGSFDSASLDSAHSKLESGRLSAANAAAYIHTCLMPGGDLPDGLSGRQDPHQPGFIL